LYRIPRFADELARFRAINNCFGFLKLVAKADLLVLDDFGLAPMTDGAQTRSARHPRAKVQYRSNRRFRLASRLPRLLRAMMRCNP